ncbi:hypothetical protein BH23PLA1_BH23PLA1_09360 [soil metagenome]
MNVLAYLRKAFAAATPAGADAESFAQAVRPSTDPKFGDYQANGCMSLAKAVKKNPRELAAEVADRVDLVPLADPPEVAGPGFLNVRLKESWMASTLRSLLVDDQLGIEPVEHPRTVIVDYSSPNVAKPMHVGHIRSTVIGESLARILSASGHKVIRDNHLGDWGTQFGMILWGWKNHLDSEHYERDPVGELARLYRLAATKIKAGEDLGKLHSKLEQLESEGKAEEAIALFEKGLAGTGLTRDEVARQVVEARAVASAAREETAKLHAGDPENRAIWERFMPHCLEALEAIYERLGVTFDV